MNISYAEMRSDENKFLCSLLSEKLDIAPNRQEKKRNFQSQIGDYF